MNAEVKATSNKQGLVSFGKIPQGTYHMKETVTPEGYKKLTNIYTVVVDGTTPIANVVHSDDDGGVIISDVEGMKLTKELDNGATKNANDSVSLEVSLTVADDYADKTRAFEFELAMPEGSQLVETTGNNESVVLTNGHITFTLTDGQTIRFTNVPATGIGDNTVVWVAIIAGSVFLMALVWRSRRFVR